MDELLKTLILGAPNLMVAIYVLWRQEKRIETLLEAQSRLLERLLTHVENEDASEAVKVGGATRSARP